MRLIEKTGIGLSGVIIAAAVVFWAAQAWGAWQMLALAYGW